MCVCVVVDDAGTGGLCARKQVTQYWHEDLRKCEIGSIQGARGRMYTNTQKERVSWPTSLYTLQGPTDAGTGGICARKQVTLEVYI